MSRIYFHSPSGIAELHGSERAWLSSLVYDVAVGLLDLKGYGNAERLQEFLSPDRRLIDGAGRLLSWAQHMETSFRVALSDEVFSYKGRAIDSFSLALNTALLVGNDQMRLAARLHGQCELHAFIEGPNRAWVADIMQRGLDVGIYRKGFRVQPDPDTPRERGPWHSQGWEQVIDLLRSRDDEPVVTSYSVTDSFPNETVARWEPPADADLTPDWAREAPDEWNAMSDREREEWCQTTASEMWGNLPAGERWSLGMEGLRTAGGFLEIKPEDWESFRFTHKLSVFDLYSEDWRERMETALGIERQDA